MKTIYTKHWAFTTLQLLSILSACLTIVCLIALYHHQTADCFVPFWKYLASVRIAFPPILLLFTSYVLVFIGGISIGDAPKVVIRYLRNQFFQNNTQMSITTVILLIVFVCITLYILLNPPPRYVVFVQSLLGSEADRHTLAQNNLKLISEKNKKLGNRLSTVSKVFIERSRRNFYHADLDTTTPRIFVRALSAKSSDESWKDHPLRKLALAEAYSMWAQAAFSSEIKASSDKYWKKWLAKCIQLNRDIIESDHQLMTPLIKYSAMHNTGNAHLYVNKLEEARKCYEKAMKMNRNLATAGNLIAVNVLQGRLDDAVLVGAQTKDWALDSGKALTETSQYSSILVNTAFAFMIKSQFDKSTEYLREAYDLEPDNLNAQNLAVSFLLQGDLGSSNKVLDKLKEPELNLDAQAGKVRTEYDLCYYFVKGLVVPQTDYARVAAYLYTYLKQPRTVSQLKSESDDTVRLLKRRVLSALEKDSTPCSDLSMVPMLQEMLSTKQEKVTEQDASADG